ncbi:MAG TPA: GGDEF domain-containing protein [Anaerolineales bacterium]|nr:GGDEF domain-containing protein [Anaerolineales bacterium]
MTIDHEELLNGYENILKRRNVLGLRLATLLLSILFPLFWLLDWVLLPRWVGLTFWLRLLGTLYSLAIWIATFRRRDFVYRHTDSLAISVGVLISWLIAILTWLDHGYESPYYAGLNLVILGCSFLFVWPLRRALGFNLLIYSFYMVPLLLGIIPVHDPVVAISNQFFILSTLLISIISQQHRLSQERKDYVAIQQHRVLLEQAQALAATDPLTGLYNRREFFSLGAFELEHARRLNKPLSVLAIDIDHFKQINDLHGHLVGDEFLRAAAHIFQASLRQDDILARIGGDEFMALLPATGLHEAAVIAERILLALQHISFPSTQQSLQATVSVGVALLTEDIVDLDALLLRTDEALYVAKRAGRARVHTWSEVQQDVEIS